MLSDVTATTVPGVIRLRAANPSAMTGTGTNSYLIEGDGACLLIDPGPMLQTHLAAIIATLAGRRLAAILVTHAHLDHSALAQPLARETGAPVLAFGGATSGRSQFMQRLAAQGLTSGGEGMDHAFAPDRLLQDGDQLALAGRTLTIWHTPGHLGGHLCFGLDDVLFSGDHVMGWSSSLVSPPDGDMAAYRASLMRLKGQAWAQMLPGHGAAIMAPDARLAELITHRQAREVAILAALAQGPASATTLARQIYTDTPPALLPAAARNILAHLVDLYARNLIAAPAPIHDDSQFQMI